MQARKTIRVKLHHITIARRLPTKLFDTTDINVQIRDKKLTSSFLPPNQMNASCMVNWFYSGTLLCKIFKWLSTCKIFNHIKVYEFEENLTIEWFLRDRCRNMIRYVSIGDLIGWAEIQYLACWVTHAAIRRYTLIKTIKLTKFIIHKL